MSGNCLFEIVYIIFDIVSFGIVLTGIAWRIDMKEFSSAKKEDIKQTQIKNDKGRSNILFELEKPLRNALRKIITFICFGPGVLGVLWLIGRILKR